MSLKLVEYNLNIYIMLFELKKNYILTDFYFVVFTQTIFFTCNLFVVSFSATLNIMKY